MQSEILQHTSWHSLRFEIHFVSLRAFQVRNSHSIWTHQLKLRLSCYRFIQYNPTSLERNYRYEVLTEHDLGVSIDLINKDVYAVDLNATLDPADEKLLEEDILTPQDSKRSRHHARSVSWLRRTEYISTEQTRFQPQVMDKVEAKVGYSIKKNLKNETLYMDRDSQIKAIEKTFDDAKVPLDKHYSKPNVVAVEVLPVYPDYKLWKYPCAQVIFDSDPAPVGKLVPAQIEEMSQAMIRLVQHFLFYLILWWWDILFLQPVIVFRVFLAPLVDNYLWTGRIYLQKRLLDAIICRFKCLLSKFIILSYKLSPTLELRDLYSNVQPQLPSTHIHWNVSFTRAHTLA